MTLKQSSIQEGVVLTQHRQVKDFLNRVTGQGRWVTRWTSMATCLRPRWSPYLEEVRYGLAYRGMDAGRQIWPKTQYTKNEQDTKKHYHTGLAITWVNKDHALCLSPG